MPLVQSNTRQAIAENIHRLHAENSSRLKPRDDKQIIAIALNVARKRKNEKN
jgi:hypothetical protein